MRWWIPLSTALRPPGTTSNAPTLSDGSFEEHGRVSSSSPGTSRGGGRRLRSVGLIRLNIIHDADALGQHFGALVGVIVSDSVGRAWRTGTVAIALGAAGIKSVDDIRGKPDLFGRDLRVSIVGHADQVAAAAALVIGEAAEGTPVALVRGLPRPDTVLPASDLNRPPSEDLFR
jgi:hypothetical protein